jgi:hypothetical protein
MRVIQPGSRRPPPIATAVVTAVLSISPATIAQQSSRTTVPSSAAPRSQVIPSVSHPAGEPTASVSGTVTDATGAVIAGAFVRLDRDGMSSSQVVVTSGDGGYSFTALSKGTYTLHITAIGFAMIYTDPFTLESNQSRTQDLTLSVQEYEGFASGGGGAINIPVVPLLALYAKSDRIVVAEVGPSSVSEVSRSQKLMRTALMASTTLKGKHQRVVYVYPMN